MNDRLEKEAIAFDRQIVDRIKNGHIPDLRRCGRCEYFYNNVWRDQEFVKLYYGEVVENPDDIVPALKRSFDAKVPALIEAVSKNIISPITKGLTDMRERSAAE